MATAFHETWKPAAYDRDLHARMGESWATNAFLTIRVALRRELILCLSRIWDTNRDSIGMRSIFAKLQDSRIASALYEGIAEGFDKDFESAVRVELETKRLHVCELISSFLPPGIKSSLVAEVRKLRDTLLAHRSSRAVSAEPPTISDEVVEELYRSTCTIVQGLVSLVLSTAFSPADVAKVHERYAHEFWASAMGERTDGHPNRARRLRRVSKVKDTFAMQEDHGRELIPIKCGNCACDYHESPEVLALPTFVSACPECNHRNILESAPFIASREGKDR